MNLNQASDTETMEWFRDRFQDVVWADTPERQVGTNVFLFGLALIASPVTLGATLVFALIFGFFGTIGMGRLVARAFREDSGGLSMFIIVVIAALIAAVMLEVTIGFMVLLLGIAGLAVLNIR